MGKSLRVFTFLLTISMIVTSESGSAGVLKSLDEELSSLVAKTEPYLVTVKGQGPWKNLIATGIVYDEEGYIVTSSHVYDADRFEVTFKNGASYPADKTGVDPQTGLAVLKIDADGLESPAWGKTATLKEGAWILVVSNSYGIPATVDFGVFAGRTVEGFLELGVDVSPGSSGGAVLDTDGRIAGVLVAVEADPEDLAYDSVRNDLLLPRHRETRFASLFRNSDSRAIAVPAGMVVSVADQLIEFGEVRRGFLGISQKNLLDSQRAEYGLDSGVLVVEVVENSPAERAGLKEGDVILAVGEDSIHNTGELFNLIRSHKPGDKVILSYYRDGERRQTEATLEEAQGSFLLGAREIRNLLPKIKVNNKLPLTDMSRMQEEISRLEMEIGKIKKDIDELRKELAD
jgi:serine protease Do